MSDPLEGPDSPPDIEIYSVSLEQDGQLKLSRRDFLSMALAAGSAMLVLTGCQAVEAVQTALAGQPAQTSTAVPLPTVNLLVQPQAGSQVLMTLHANDVVSLLNDRSDLGWTQVAVNGQAGWVSRSQVDFTRAFTREAISNAMATIPAGTPAVGPIFVLLTAPGAPEPALPVTCPSYTPGAATSTPMTDSTLPYYKPKYYNATPQSDYIRPDPFPCNCVTFNQCGCVTNINCNCVGLGSCGCLSYNFNPCPCVHFSSCGCVSNMPCSCVSNFPCSFT
jgi:hypothetical protein